MIVAGAQCSQLAFGQSASWTNEIIVTLYQILEMVRLTNGSNQACKGQTSSKEEKMVPLARLERALR